MSPCCSRDSPEPSAAAAKSLQSRPTLCDPIDVSPPGSPVFGILQARTQESVAISFSNEWKWKVKVKSLSCVWLLATPWTAAYQAPPSPGFSRQEYWSGVPLPSPQNLLQSHNLKISILWHPAFFMVLLSHLYMTTGKTIALIIRTFVGKMISLLFNALSRFVIAFLQRSKCLLILWLQSLSAVILETRKMKSIIVSTFPPSIYHEVLGQWSSLFEYWVLSQLFHSFSPSSRGSLVPLHFLPLKCYHLHISGCWYFSQLSWFWLWVMQPCISHDVLCI